MTRYEQGFMNKCAEYGVKQADAATLLANYAPEALGGALLGGGAGALASKKNRLRNALLGALLGAGAGVGVRYGTHGKLINARSDLMNAYAEKGGIPARLKPTFWERRKFYGDKDTALAKILAATEKLRNPPQPVQNPQT